MVYSISIVVFIQMLQLWMCQTPC